MAAAAGLSRAWERLNSAPRITGVDLARGLAVFGMLAAHLLWIEAFDWAHPETWSDIARGRSSILFATIAGVSIGLSSGGRTPLAGRALDLARGRLVVRATLLWVLGIALISTGVPVYVILPSYALLFLVAIPFAGLPARTVLAVAVALAAVMPFVQAWLDALPVWSTADGTTLSIALGWHYPFPVWSAFLLAGLGVARAGLTRLRVQLWLLGAGAALAAAGYGWDAVAGAPAGAIPVTPWAAVWTAQAHSSGLLEVVGSGGFALAVLGACLLLCRTALVWVVLPLRAVGAMPLTAYTGQLAAWAIAAAVLLGDPGDLAGFRDLAPFGWFAAATLVACTVWALLIGRGPLEWLTERVTTLVVPRAAPDARDVPAGTIPPSASAPPDRLNG